MNIRRVKRLLYLSAAALTTTLATPAYAANLGDYGGSARSGILTVLLLLAGTVALLYYYFDEQKRLRMQACMEDLADSADAAFAIETRTAAPEPATAAEPVPEPARAAKPMPAPLPPPEPAPERAALFAVSRIEGSRPPGSRPKPKKVARRPSLFDMEDPKPARDITMELDLDEIVEETPGSRPSGRLARGTSRPGGGFVSSRASRSPALAPNRAKPANGRAIPRISDRFKAAPAPKPQST